MIRISAPLIMREAQKYLDEITQIDEQIMQLGTNTEELKNKIDGASLETV